MKLNKIKYVYTSCLYKKLEIVRFVYITIYRNRKIYIYYNL